MGLEEEAQRNMEERLVDNPCRGIILGMNKDQDRVAVTWISERRENSRNMRLVVKDKMVRTEPGDPNLDMDPVPGMYTAMAETSGGVIISNGSQTERLYRAMQAHTGSGPGGFFGELSTLYCEHDAPIFTPRISAYVPFIPNQVFFSILKADAAEKEKWLSHLEMSGLNRENFREEGRTEADITRLFNQEVSKQAGINAYEFPTKRLTFDLALTPGYGFCITTYKPGSSTLDSFEGEPFIVPIRGTVENVMEKVWQALDSDFRVAIAGKCIKEDKAYTPKPINSYEIT